MNANTRSRKRFTKLLPQVLTTEKQYDGVIAQADANAMSLSQIIRAAIECYLDANPLEDSEPSEVSESK